MRCGIAVPWGTRWRRLTAGEQALLVLVHLLKGETYADLAAGFLVGTTTVFRYIREALDVLAALAPTLRQLRLSLYPSPQATFQ